MRELERPLTTSWIVAIGLALAALAVVLIYNGLVRARALVREGLYEPAFEFVLKKRWSRGEATEVDTGYAFGLRGYFD